MTAYCPNCEKEVTPYVTKCMHCNADFSTVEGWRPTAEPGTGKPRITATGAAIQVIGRLIAGAIGWFVFMLFALFAAFGGGYSAGKAWIGLAQILAIVVLIWALLPLYRFFAKKWRWAYSSNHTDIGQQT